MPRSRPDRPGLARARAPALQHRTLHLVRSPSGFAEWFQGADVVSEGRPRDEPEGRRWYGSTSIELPIPAGEDGGRELERLRDTAMIDPHVRLRAVRIACLEATVRAGEPLADFRAELTIATTRRGLRIDVELEAATVQEPQRRGRRAR